MKRRDFLQATSVTAAAWMVGCSSAHTNAEPDADAGPSDAPSHPDAHDGGLLEQVDAPHFDPDARDGLVIHEAFEVLLNDSSCSGHPHSVRVVPGAYAEDIEVHYMGGSHALNFWVSELVRLQNGERIPFATHGSGGHGHCGTAWRTEVGPAEPDRVDACDLRAPATNMQCISRPRM